MHNALVVLTYNSKRNIAANWASYLQTKYPTTTFVIDNASTDGTVGLFQQAGIPVHVYPTNVGFSAGINIGLRKALEIEDLEWVFICNPDVQLHPEWDSIVDCLTLHNHCGIVGARLVNHLGHVTHTGGMIGSPKLMYWPLAYQLGDGYEVVQQEAVCETRFQHCLQDTEKEPHEVPWVTFAFVALRAKMLREIGLIDETYFLMCSDAELCRRAVSAGWQVWMNPSVTFEHEGSASIKQAGSEIQQKALADFRRFARWEADNFGRDHRTPD